MAFGRGRSSAFEPGITIRYVRYRTAQPAAGDYYLTTDDARDQSGALDYLRLYRRFFSFMYTQRIPL